MIYIISHKKFVVPVLEDYHVLHFSAEYADNWDGLKENREQAK